MCSCGRRCSSVLFKKRGTCKIPSVHSASHLLPALGFVYSSIDPPLWGVNSQDPRALSPLAIPRLRDIARSIPGTRLPWIAFRAYCSDRGSRSGHPGASISRFWPGIPPPLSYSTSLSGFPHFGSSRSHLCRHKPSGSTGRSRSLAQLPQAHLLPWNDLVPSSPVSSHSRTNQASSGGAVYSVCAADSRKQPQICPLRAGKNGAVRPARAIVHPAGTLRPHGVPGIGELSARQLGVKCKQRYHGRVLDEPDERNRFAHYLTG